MLITYTIYDHPIDYPDKFVIRKFDSGQPTLTAYVANTLEEARTIVRHLMPDGGFCFPRDETDDVKIVETWM